MLEQANSSRLTGFAEPSQDSSQANRGLAPTRPADLGHTRDTSSPHRPGLSRRGPCLPEPRGPERRCVGGISNTQQELRRGLDGASALGTASASCSRVANAFVPRGDVAGVGGRLPSLLPAKMLPRVPAYSLHPPQRLGEKAVRGEVGSAPGLSPTPARLSPESPTCFSSPPKYLNPSTLLLFFHFIFRSAAPVSSFLFVFGSYYSWLLSVLVSLLSPHPDVYSRCLFFYFPKVPPGCSWAEVCVWTGQALSHSWAGTSC